MAATQHAESPRHDDRASLEDLFSLRHLGFAAQGGLQSLGPDVYNAP